MAHIQKVWEMLKATEQQTSNQHVTRCTWIWLICSSALFVLASPTNPSPLAGQVRNRHAIIPLIYDKTETIWVVVFFFFFVFRANYLGETFGVGHSSCCSHALTQVCLLSTTCPRGSVTCNMFRRHSKVKSISPFLLWKANVTNHHHRGKHCLPTRTPLPAAAALPPLSWGLSFKAGNTVRPQPLAGSPFPAVQSWLCCAHLPVQASSPLWQGLNCWTTRLPVIYFPMRSSEPFKKMAE